MAGSLDIRTWRTVFLILLLSLASRACFASDLLVRSLAPGQDARQRSVLALLQSREGYIWIGTGNGLLRFDGVGFTSFTAANTPGITGDRISFGTLWEDPGGAIWAGTDFSGVLRNDHGHWQTLGEHQGLSGGGVLRIDGDETGAVWIYTEGGVNRWARGHLDRADPNRENGTESKLIFFSRKRTIDLAKAGLWRHSTRGLERFAYGHWTGFPIPALNRSFEEDVREIFEDRAQRVWYSLFSYAHTVFCAEHGMLRRYEGVPADAVVSYEDRAGYLWLTDHQAHSSLWKGGHSYPLPQMSAPFLLQVLEPKDGTLWAGTAGTDLFQFRRRSVEIAPIPGAPEIASVLFQQRAGQIWAGGTRVLHHTAASGDTAFSSVHAPDQPANWIQIKALGEDAQGDLLVGSRGAEGLETLSGAGFQHDTAISGTVQSILLSRSSEVWVGSTTGLYRGSGQKAMQVTSVPVRCLLETPEGALLAGTDRGPMLFRDGQQDVHVFPAWSYGPVVAAKLDGSGSIWMATQDHGLVLFEGGAFVAFGARDGLPTDVLYSLEFDDLGDLWMGSDVGLMRIRGKSIQRRLRDSSSRLQVTVFDAADGLPASIFDPLGNQGSLRRPDGDLWFGTEQGVAVIHPSTLRANSTDTHPVIEEHEIDQSNGLPADDIKLQPGQTNLQIHYTALGSNNPEQLVFRYRLQNYDRDWVYARNRRVAYYSHLAPGTYAFQVQVADNDGEGWVQRIATTTVTVLTPFYRSWWFLLLVFLSAAGSLVYNIDQRRRRSLQEQRSRQMFTQRLINTQESERKRIAHELHDSIGQHLVLIRTLAMLPSVSASSGPGGHLASIADQAAVAIKEVETISYDLRPYQLDRLGLTKAVLSSIQTFERSSSIEVECTIDNIDNFFPKDVEIKFLPYRARGTSEHPSPCRGYASQHQDSQIRTFAACRDS